MEYIANAFSLGMLDQPEGADLRVRRINVADVPTSAVSIVGHADTALLLSALLGREVPTNMASTSLEFGDIVYVAQYNGPRLPEGAKIRWIRVYVDSRTSVCEFCGFEESRACCGQQSDHTPY